MIGHEMASASRAILPLALRRLLKGGDVFTPGGDLHRLGLPQSEGVHRSTGPGPAGTAVAIAHALRFARHLDLDRATEALSLVHHLVSLRCLPCPLGANLGERSPRCDRSRAALPVQKKKPRPTARPGLPTKGVIAGFVITVGEDGFTLARAPADSRRVVKVKTLPVARCVASDPVAASFSRTSGSSRSGPAAWRRNWRTRR